MACSSSYVTADEVWQFFCRGSGYSGSTEPSQESVDEYIRKSAAHINMTLSATGQCGCSANSIWAADFLQELNLVGAALLIQCPDCGRHFTQEQREFWNTWLGTQLGLLRSGELDICDGATAPQYPSVTWAEQSVTDWNAARIVVNDRLRSS